MQFPRKGCEKLLTQLVGFGVERDDLLDALTLGIIYLMEQKNKGPNIRIVSVKGTVFDRDLRMRSAAVLRGRYNAATASDEEFFSSPTGVSLY